MSIKNPDYELSIIMPCLNEAETLATCIKKAKSFLTDNGISGEVIVADNGSTDGSQAIAARAGARVVHVTRKGYGSALMGGIEAARGAYIIMGDADDSYDFSALENFVEKLREGCDLVMGNRFAGGILPGAMPFLHQYLGNPVLSGIGRLFFSSHIGDFHCGLRGFKREAIQCLELQTTGMEFASEMVVKATLHRLKISEVPILLHPDGRTRPPHLRSWRDGWRHLRFLLMYSPDWLFLYPGFILILLGCLGMTALLPGPLHIGAVTFDIHTLLISGVAIILGMQSVSFAILSSHFALNSGLLPKSTYKNNIFPHVPLELLLLLGVGFMILGVGGVGYSIYLWYIAQFGDLIATQMMRLLVPSLTLIAVGFQIIITGFFKGILDLKVQLRESSH